MTFGETFQTLLRERGLTQSQAARLLGMHQSSVSRFCCARRPPRLHVISHIAAALGVDPSSLAVGAIRPEPAEKGKGRRASQASLEELLFADAMQELRDRWRRNPDDRDAIRHLVALLFPRNASQLQAWLKKA